MTERIIVGLGWDVGGWCGSKQGLAAALWAGTQVRWLGAGPRACTLEQFIPSDWDVPDLLRVIWPDAPPREELAARYRIVLAIDAPLGFPVEFVNLLCGRPVLDVIPGAKEINNGFAYRETDRHVHHVFDKKPLSASFDKLGNNATVAMMHVWRLRQSGRLRGLPFDAPDVSVPNAIEVYPALLNTSKLARSEAGRLLELQIGSAPVSAPRRSDAHDACICALLGLAFGHEGRLPCLPAIAPIPADVSLPPGEGWIFYPMV